MTVAAAGLVTSGAEWQCWRVQYEMRVVALRQHVDKAKAELDSGLLVGCTGVSRTLGPIYMQPYGMVHPALWQLRYSGMHVPYSGTQ